MKTLKFLYKAFSVIILIVIASSKLFSQSYSLDEPLEVPVFEGYSLLQLAKEIIFGI